MKKKLFFIVLALVLCFGLAACGNSEEKVTYESIYNDYSSQLEAAVPDLIAEYESEIADDENESTPYEIYMAKIEKLATIYTDGVQEMSKLFYDDMTEESEAEYDKWGEQLTEVYEDCGDQLSEAMGI